MSEFQYYEFLAIDRPLGAEEIAEVRKLSSRVQPTASHAAFTYAYGDFPGDALALLAKYYDAMLYIANWGTKQLAFRFPKAAIDQAALQPYYYGVEEIELSTVGQYLILNITFQEEGGFGWIDDSQGQLGPLAALRDDTLRGDLRALYLAWLASAARVSGLGANSSSEDLDNDEEFDDEEFDDEKRGDPTEPPVPAGLGQLTAPLRALMEFFEIDQDLVGAAAQASPPLKATDEPLERWVQLLPEPERNTFLARAARGEPIGAELLRRLREVGGAARPAASGAARRTFSTIAAVAEQVRGERQKRERQKHERAQLAKLEALAKREEQVWEHIPRLLGQRTAAGYEQAVAHLAELRDLAAHRKQRAEFDLRLGRLLAPFASSAALLRRLREQKLVK